MAVRKTIRFYDDQGDVEALRILENHKKYGYSSEREMIIKALSELAYNTDEINFPDATEIAQKVVEQLRAYGISVQSASSENVVEGIQGVNGTKKIEMSESLDDALDFIDML